MVRWPIDLEYQDNYGRMQHYRAAAACEATPEGKDCSREFKTGDARTWIFLDEDRFTCEGYPGDLDRFKASLQGQATTSKSASNESSQPAVGGDDLHQLLQQLIASARSGFTDLRGHPIVNSSLPSGHAWTARDRPPGGEECRVWKGDSGIGPYYTCVMAKGSSRDDVEPAYRRFVHQVATALGREWSKETDSSRTRLVETTFTKKGSDLEFDVYVSEHSRRVQLGA